MIEFITTIMYFIAFFISFRIMSVIFHAVHIHNQAKIIKNLEEMNRQNIVSDSVIPTFIEEHYCDENDKKETMFFAFNAMNQRFLAQGSTPQDLSRNMNINFPNSKFRILNDRDLLFKMKGMKEFIIGGMKDAAETKT